MESAKSNEMMMFDDPGIKFENRSSRERILTFVVLAVGIIFLIVGIALIAVSADKNNEASVGKSGSTDKQGGKEEKTTAFVPTEITGSTKNPTETPAPPTTPATSSRCVFSEEAKRVGLSEFLGRVKATFYKLHPYDVYWDPDVTESTVRKEYVAYDPTPSIIKTRTDTALALLKEINDKTINTDAMKPRERKALAQVKHYLQHMFGQPYDVNYYAGDWMMGPNLFCWQEICYHGYGVHNGLGLRHKPYNASDVELIETKLKTHKAGILQYIKNMQMGVRKGMVRSVEECQAGINTIKRQYLNVSLYNSTGEEMLC